jgi:hypothetical protein
MDVNYVLLLFVAIIMALAYGIIGYFSARMSTGDPWSWSKFAATIVYSVVVGFFAVQTGVITLENIANWQAILSPVWTEYILIYTGLLYVFSKFVVPAVQQFTSKTVIYPKKEGVSPSRKMDAETRNWLVSDQKEPVATGVLKAVDAAEAEGTYRYAIEAGAWIYLVEFGEVTGAKHYYFRGWFGTATVAWKAITSECLETIRKTGRFPEYSELY